CNIRIVNVTMAFKITNCYLASDSSGVLTDPYDCGIYLINVRNAILSYNYIANNEDYGIYLESSNIVGYENVLWGNYRGIIFNKVVGDDIYSNEILNSTDTSVWILNCSDFIFRQHLVSAMEGQGLLIQDSSDCLIYYNDFDNIGVEISDSTNCQLYSNVFSDGSRLLIEESSRISVTGNNIITPTDYGINVSLSNHCTVSRNIIKSTAIAGIAAIDSLSCNYTANIISECRTGILLQGETSSLVTNNYVCNQTEYGIRIDDSSENWVYANLIASEGAGFFLDNGGGNHWDDGLFLGNFLPGITEGTFQIDGSAGSEDQFARPIDPVPILEPVICSDPIMVKLGKFEGILACVVWLRADTDSYGYWIVGCSVQINGEGAQGVGCVGSSTIMIHTNGFEAGIYNVSLDLSLHVFPLDVGVIHIADFSFFLPGFYSIYDGDDDGMVDEWEVENGLNPLIDDSHQDPDHDHLDNDQEAYWSTDPHNPDSDQDQMPDGWETFYGLRPLLDDSREDGDADGLSNLDEYLHRTDPTNSDSDFDSIPDGWEVTYGLDPMFPADIWLDYDSDTLTNLREFQLGTDPTNPDSDSDSFRDDWEVRNGFDPLSPNDAMYENIVYFSPFIASFFLTMFALTAVTVILNRKLKVDQHETAQRDEEDEIKRYLEFLLSS
ncbi:MAG: right-handed parallel beta-helix repeat-containing protein, partial [Candidatus Thorarchaeota archaeon]